MAENEASPLPAGDDVCPDCDGTGVVAEGVCDTCGGTGWVSRAPAEPGA
jgi:DnaJ-class molecular chaperone